MIIQNRRCIYRTLLDMNNLYGYGMSDCLPYGGFKWLKNADNFDVSSVNKKGPIVCIFEVDVKYPDKLHVLHNDYPLVPKRLAIPYRILSDYCKNIRIWNKSW